MFIRIRKNRGTFKRSVVICHNIRVGNKIRQVIVKTMGHSLDPMVLEGWLEEAKAWISARGQSWLIESLPMKKEEVRMKRQVSLFNLKERARVNVGIEDIFGQLYDALGFQDLLSPSHQKTLRQVLFSRLLEPGSKRRLSEVSEKKLDEELPVDRIYRMMDALLNETDRVQQKIFEAAKAAHEGYLSLVLFDVTTLSFESIEEDDLRAFGYSKDFKFNTTQVTLALATTSEGLPVGFKLFPGNTAESKTLIESVTVWREQVPIGKVTVVGDRAMMSQANLLQLESAHFEYVVAFPLRKLSKAYKECVLDKASYQENTEGNEINRYRIIEWEGRRLCVSYSEKRALKDKKDRERLVEKAKKKLQTCKNVKRLINGKGYLKYSKIKGEAIATLNEEKIKEDEKWDGLHGVISNKEGCGMEVYAQYRRLWVIEESFRINKHNLKMRPIYHFTPRRIQAHILLCTMVFSLVRHLQFKLQQAAHSMSVARIIDSLRDVQASILVDTTNDKTYRMLSSLSEDAHKIYKICGVKQESSVVVT